MSDISDLNTPRRFSITTASLAQRRRVRMILLTLKSFEGKVEPELCPPNYATTPRVLIGDSVRALWEATKIEVEEHLKAMDRAAENCTATPEERATARHAQHPFDSWSSMEESRMFKMNSGIILNEPENTDRT